MKAVNDVKLNYLVQKILALLGGKSDTDHTHKYAASESAGGSALKAVQLVNARNIQTNLSSSSAAAFDGSSDVAPGVTGILPIPYGGTGSATASDARASLDVLSTSEVGSTITAALASNMIGKIATGSYTGVGCYGAGMENVLTFDFKPQFVLISPLSINSIHLLFIRDSGSYSVGNNTITIWSNAVVTWGENSVTWYCTADSVSGVNETAVQANTAGVTYYYFAVGGEAGTGTFSNNATTFTVTDTTGNLPSGTFHCADGTTWASAYSNLDGAKVNSTTSYICYTYSTSDTGAMITTYYYYSLRLNGVDVLSTDAVVDEATYTWYCYNFETVTIDPGGGDVSDPAGGSGV